jgi:SAM-dependent methyltransferase
MPDINNQETCLEATKRAIAIAEAEIERTAKRQKKYTETETTTTTTKTDWKVFPPKAYANSQPPFALTLGQTVFVRSKSGSEKGRRGKFVQLEDKDAEADATKSDRCQIEWEQEQEQDNDSAKQKLSSESTTEIASVARKRLLPVDTSTWSSVSESASAPASVQVIVTATTQKFRLLAQSHTISTDHVLELGCSSGETSTILWQYCASWVGFDTSSNMIQKVKDLLEVNSKKNNKKSKKQPTQTTASASCYQLNALADPATAVEHACEYSGPTGPTVIYLDIGGNREEAGVIRMMQWILQSFPKVHTVIIKSQEVHKALSNTDKCNDSTGEFAGGHEWFQDRLQVAVTATLPRHPLQAPKMLSPVDGTTPICRYHNYFKDGCGKGDICPYDHDHCHLCLKTGHIATQCPLLQR